MTRKRMSRDAQLLLDALIEEFRVQMFPAMAPEDWRAAYLELHRKGLAQIYDLGGRFELHLTPSGTALAEYVEREQRP